MLRALTEEQISDWFTIGKAVTAVELLGEEPPAGALRGPPRRPPRGPLAAREAFTAAGLPVKESVGTEYTEKYGRAEAQELDAVGNDQLVYKPDTSLSQCESSAKTSIPITNHKCVDMPIAKHREEIVSLIESNSVVIVQGATGSGKSTQVPLYILDYCIQQSIYCNIAVTQPRKIGASSIARWISKERSWRLGGFVGYQVSLENISTKDTRLLYVTTGVLLQKIVCAKSLAEFTHIFIDEVHERTDEMDFLLLVIRKLLRTNSQSVKIILMSASINCKEFADYFALPAHNGLNPACVFKVEGKPYAIEEYYLDDLKHTVRFKLPPQRIEEPVIVKEMYEVAVSLIESFDELEMKSNREKKTSSVTSERGSVLVFLPGLSEISYMHSCLSNMFNKRWQLYPLHSCVTLEEQSNVFLTTVPGYRKVILSTNIAESSLTVPDVKYVIDFCLTRTLVCDGETNYQSLRLCWASKANCNQRKGRAGRVSKGYCYRLVHKEFWTDFIPEKSVPEILRCPLGTTVLKIKMLDMGGPKALLATALSPPSVGDIERTVLQLKELGALKTCAQAEENPHDGELTFLGRVLAQLPVDLRLGKLIVLGHVFGCLEECLIIAAALSLRNFFAAPFKQHVDGYRNKLFFAENSKSDCIAIVNAFKMFACALILSPSHKTIWIACSVWLCFQVAVVLLPVQIRTSSIKALERKAWQACRQKGELRHPKEELEWGKSNCIHIKKIREVAELFHNLKRRVRAFNMCVKAQPSAMDQECVYKQRFILQVVIAGAFYPNYFTFGKCDEEIATRVLAGKDPKTTVMLKNIPPYGYLYHKQLQSLFRQCGQVKSIAYDGSKAFVEFSHSPMEGFKILPAVYLSVKMSQLKIPLELNVHYPDDIERQLQGVTTAGVKSLRVNVDCQKQSVEPVEISFGTSQQSKMIPSSLLCIKITEIVEVGHFWGYRIDEKTRTALQALTAEISYQNLTDLAVSPCPEMVCLAPFTHLEDRGYYRARILYVCGDFAEVFFVDYGNRSKVPLNKLKEIPSCLQGLPFQALEFKICRMRPSAKSLVCGEQWSYSASQRFASLVNGYPLLVKVYSLVHGVLHVDVFQYSRCRELVNIRDVLVEECYAELAAESYESQQSHDLLKGLFLDQVKKEEKMPVSSREEEKHVIERLLNQFSDIMSDAPTHKVTVLGPFSPYEVKCYSMTRVSQFRSAFIQKESINSVVVHGAPEDPFQQLLVAASLTTNATGSTVILEETSLMPPIPGLLALLSMLFAPAIELRVDKSGKYFTGVLCGLGWSQVCGAPLLPENDMELMFDVHFGVEDISEINFLRTAINELLCECAVCSGQERMTQLQENVRQKLLCLICKSKPRDKIVPTWYEKPYAWNQVDSQQVIDKSGKQHERINGIYQLHKLVVLNV
ncbi:ATP-dependent RNA helicase TDRD9 isoform X2 [Tyto alba]|uniref:ATP-dependent RNA helicase TDRD9 isoform X2 n=1 Tax=Tyto alba TaxID=56313 RepID=UPI001C678821|nr:ATP-dependent RNA helicase TDRD9 isoform X2 [Tyto alba]